MSNALIYKYLEIDFPWYTFAVFFILSARKSHSDVRSGGSFYINNSPDQQWKVSFILIIFFKIHMQYCWDTFFFILCISPSVASDLTDSWLFCTKLKQLCNQFVLKRITSVLKTSVNKALLKGFSKLKTLKNLEDLVLTHFVYAKSS